MKVLLVFPKYSYAAGVTYQEPLGVLYLASSLLKAGIEVELEDMTFSQNLNGLTKKVHWADVVGISSTTPIFGTAISMLNHVRKIKPDVTCIIGGAHATAHTADALRPGFDIAVVGEGEETMVELVRTIEQGGSLDKVSGLAFLEDGELKKTAPHKYISNLDEIPLPARQYIDYSRYRRFGVMTMRGCPYRCSYCKPVEDKLFGNKLRKRSLENVVGEIKGLLEQYGNREVNFKDDTLTTNNAEWFDRLGEEFQSHKQRIVWQCTSRVDTVNLLKLKAMKNAGCRQIYFGIESGSQRILDYYNKDIKVEQIIDTFALCRKVGIRACASVMVGAPSETREDLEKTYQIIKTIKPFNWQIHVTTPISGSYLYDQVKAEGRLNEETDYSVYEPTGNMYRLHLPMKLEHLTSDDISEYRSRINRYMKFRLLLKCLIDPHIWVEIFSSKGFRIIALDFIRRHFKFFNTPASR